MIDNFVLTGDAGSTRSDDWVVSAEIERCADVRSFTIAG